jgi:hypothetical protein
MYVTRIGSDDAQTSYFDSLCVCVGYDVRTAQLVKIPFKTTLMSMKAFFFVNQADRTESYTRITPFQEKHDTSVEYVLLLGGPRSYPVLRFTLTQILLQAINSIGTFMRFDRPCLCRNNSGCAGGGPRQETRV